MGAPLKIEQKAVNSNFLFVQKYKFTKSQINSQSKYTFKICATRHVGMYHVRKIKICLIFDFLFKFSGATPGTSASLLLVSEK